MTSFLTTNTPGDATQEAGLMSGLQPCTCPACDTDEYLVPESVEASARLHTAQPTVWDVSYWCGSCEGYFAHQTGSLPVQWRIPEYPPMPHQHRGNTGQASP